jgi:TonB family protein
MLINCTLMKPSVVAYLLFVTAVSGVAAQPSPEAYVPMKVIQTDQVIFPRAARDVGLRSGEVHVAIQVDEAGKLTDHLVTAYTHPAFAESCVAALKRWRYEPAYLQGRAHGATVDLTFNFESRGLVVVDLTVGSYVELRNYQLHPETYTYRACTLRQLDRIPTPTKVVKPSYPVEAAQQHSGKVTVDFYIDERGRVRMPAVTRSTTEMNMMLSSAAVQAVSQWEFEPPLSKGRPVLVAARQDFNFTPEK